MKKILFLDVDGVLNNTTTLSVAAENRQFDPLDDGLLANLKEIVELTKCEIILSSTWRLNRDTLKKLRLAFHKLGISHLFDRTPVVGNGDKRHLEIEAWLCKNISEKTIAVVIDDNDDAKIINKVDNVFDHFVQTSRHRGLDHSALKQVLDAFATHNDPTEV